MKKKISPLANQSIFSPVPAEKTAQWLADADIDETTGQVQKYRQLVNNPDTKEVYKNGMCRELGRLARGFGKTAGTNTIFL